MKDAHFLTTCWIRRVSKRTRNNRTVKIKSNSAVQFYKRHAKYSKSITWIYLTHNNNNNSNNNNNNNSTHTHTHKQNKTKKRLIQLEVFVTNLLSFEHQMKKCQLTVFGAQRRKQLWKWLEDVVNKCLEFATRIQTKLTRVSEGLAVSSI